MTEMLHPNTIPSPTWRLQGSHVQPQIHGPEHRLHAAINRPLINIGTGCLSAAWPPI